MFSKAMLASLMVTALGVGLLACSDGGSVSNNNNEDLCGNGAVDFGEECDGDDFDGEDCTTLGMNGGSLGCTSACTFDVSACLGCGNGQIEVGEVCDGSDLDGQTCEDEGLISGTLACAADCTGYDTSGCDTSTTGCDPDESITLDIGEVEVMNVDTATETDELVVGCEGPDGGANERVTEIVLSADGDLVVTSPGDWHVFSLFPDPGNSPSCYSPTREIGCHDPYDAGPYAIFAGLTAGTYYLVVSDWSADHGEALEYHVSVYASGGEYCNNGEDEDNDGLVDCDDPDCATVAYCVAENCSNGVDDNLDGTTDCQDFNCIGTASCTGGVCAADHDLGLVDSTLDATVTFDTTTASDDYDLACGTAGSAEYVISFSLDATSVVSLDYTQSSADANVLGFYFEGGTGSTCIDQEYFCFTPGGPTVAGSLASNPLPPGNYYFIVEASNGGGPATANFTVDLVCPFGQHDENGVCVANTCQATDLGTATGAAIVTQGDSCTGTTYYFPQSSCTGWSANAEELVYSITVPTGATIDATQVPINGAILDSSLYVLDACTDWEAFGCLAGADDTVGSDPEVLSYTNATGADQLIYIVADSYGGCGEFELTIR